MPGQADVTRPGEGEFGAVAQYYDHLMRTVPYTAWVDYVEEIIKRWWRGRIPAAVSPVSGPGPDARCDSAFGPSRPALVLDLACGTGRVGSEMMRRGYQAIGADLSEPMVRECARQDPPLAAVVSDACSLSLAGETFDAIVCLYDSLNYILDLECFRAAMAEGYRVLRPGGLFIFDLNTIRALSTEMFTQASLTGPDPLHYDWHAYWDPKTRLCRVEMWFGYHEGGQVREFSETHYQRAYTNREVTGALEAAGFRKHKAYHAYRFSPVTPWTDRAYYVARKE